MQETLKILADNPLLFDEVKKCLKKHFSLDGMETTGDNETLGQLVRARVDGLKKLEEAFREIASCATVKPKDEQVNPAR